MRRKVNNLLALAILAQLTPGQPMHPYEIATVLKRTGKERDMNIKWGSLYTVVGNLEKYGFIEAAEPNRAGRRPERTPYMITDAGRAELTDWLRDLLANPEPEFPRFGAALSVLSVLGPDEVIVLLEQRAAALDATIAADRAMLAGLTQLPRLFLVEAEYALAMQEAEVAWVRSLLSEMTGGTLDGIDAWRTYHETGKLPDDIARMFAEVVSTDWNPTEGGPPSS
jgi:DNA-binding PadR family transcriptional regulator